MDDPSHKLPSLPKSIHQGINILRKADAIFLEGIRAAGLYDAIWQAFAVLLPVRTVGVMGDGRTYDMACALRAASVVRASYSLRLA